MRVIYNALKEHERQCDSCGSILAYTEKDIYWSNNDYMGNLYSASYIRCPVCGERIIFEVV